jgi:ABC-type transport system substrate-binding protein
MVWGGMKIPVTLGLTLLLCACSLIGDDGKFDMILVGTPDEMYARRPPLADAGQQMREATVDGLVGFDGAGQVAPALADRWIVTDDGKSYIFRMRDGVWPDGSELTGESVRDSLRRALVELRGTSLGLDLAPVSDIRAMAGRVVEIRLSTPMPDLLQLLAQPELGLTRRGRGSGLLRLKRQGDMAMLDPVPPEKRGLPALDGWNKNVRNLEVRAFPARRAIALFDEGDVDVVLGGRLEYLPLIDVGPLSRGTVRMDRVSGLFGLRILSDKGFMADPARREAIAMAIDRDKLIAPFNVSGWQPTTRIVAPGTPRDPGIVGERWIGMTVEQRQAEARRRVLAWRASNPPLVLAIAMPDGPGADIIFKSIRADLGTVGIGVVAVSDRSKADLAIMDEEARYAGASWYLNQFNCTLKTGLCSEQADARVAEAAIAPDVATAGAHLAEAEAELTRANVYVPFGVPLRWSLVRGNVQGFEPNMWGVHPLSALALVPR